jgi:hypothetical protein
MIDDDAQLRKARRKCLERIDVARENQRVEGEVMREQRFYGGR